VVDLFTIILVQIWCPLSGPAWHWEPLQPLLWLLATTQGTPMAAFVDPGTLWHSLKLPAAVQPL
jgi:hypothetical protein